MIITNKVYDFIKKEEGCVLHSYLDSVGVATIGWGSTMYKDGKRVKLGETITQQQAEDLHKWEVETKAKIVLALLGNTKVNQNQFDAILSFTYNCGIGALEKSTLLKKVRLNPNDPSIRDAFMMYNKGHKNGKLIVLDGLSRRRKREADYYFTKTA